MPKAVKNRGTTESKGLFHSNSIKCFPHFRRYISKEGITEVKQSIINITDNVNNQ